jgi:predicted transcriptional regulator
MLGLTEGELASALGLEPSRAESLVHKLIAEGVLARRGRRLIAGGSARAQGS